MPINVAYQPPAAVVGAAGMARGQADYQRWAYEQALRAAQAQQQAELERRQQDLQRINNLTSAASQFAQQAMQGQQQLQRDDLQGQYGLAFRDMDAYNRAQMLQQQQDFETQKQQAAFDYASQRSVQDAAEQDAFSEAQMQRQIRGQEIMQQRQALLNPLAQFEQQSTLWKQQGMEFTPEQMRAIVPLKSRLMGISGAVQRGELTNVDGMTAMKPILADLHAMQPAPAPPTLEEQFAKETLVDPTTGGRFAKTDKGWHQIADGPKAEKAGPIDKIDHEMEFLKREEQWQKIEDKRQERIQKQIESYMASHPAGVDPLTGKTIPAMAEPPGLRDLLERSNPGIPRPVQRETGTTIVAPGSPSPSPSAAPEPLNPAQILGAIQQKYQQDPVRLKAAQTLSEITRQFGPDPNRWPDYVKGAAIQAKQALLPGPVNAPQPPMMTSDPFGPGSWNPMVPAA